MEANTSLLWDKEVLYTLFEEPSSKNVNHQHNLKVFGLFLEHLILQLEETVESQDHRIPAETVQKTIWKNTVIKSSQKHCFFKPVFHTCVFIFWPSKWEERLELCITICFFTICCRDSTSKERLYKSISLSLELLHDFMHNFLPLTMQRNRANLMFTSSCNISGGQCCNAKDKSWNREGRSLNWVHLANLLVICQPLV